MKKLYTNPKLSAASVRSRNEALKVTTWPAFIAGSSCQIEQIFKTAY